MACYIINYDLRQPLRNYDKLYEAIKSYGYWAQVLESTWAVVTSQTSADVYNALARHMDDNDGLFVVNWGGQATWDKVLCDDEFLKQALQS